MESLDGELLRGKRNPYAQGNRRLIDSRECDGGRVQEGERERETTSLLARRASLLCLESFLIKSKFRVK